MDLRASDVLSAVLAGSRCPACAAAVRPGAPWCTLCYHDLRPTPPETVTPLAPPAAVTPPTTPAAVTPPTALTPLALLPPSTTPAQPTTAAAPGAASWPCSACGQANPYSVSACAACGTGFLAGLRETEGPLLELPVVGDLAALSRGQRLGLAAGVVLAVIALTVIVGLLFG